jgi:serine/threonine protein kinase
MDGFWLADASIRPSSSMGRQPLGRQEDDIKEIFRQLVKAVQRVHMHGIFHGRLYPETILWKESSRTSSNHQPELLLGDFCASLLALTSRDRWHWISKQTMFVASRREFMPPELYNGEVFDGIAADMWSLGTSCFIS